MDYWELSLTEAVIETFGIHWCNTLHTVNDDDDDDCFETVLNFNASAMLHICYLHIHLFIHCESKKLITLQTISWLIFKIRLPSDSARNLQQNVRQISHHTLIRCYTTLWNIKIKK